MTHILVQRWAPGHEQVASSQYRCHSHCHNKKETLLTENPMPITKATADTESIKMARIV